MRFSQSTHLLICLSLETLTPIIRTGLPILVELIDLLNFVIIFLSQITLLRWLTFLLESQAMILTLLFFWIYLFPPMLKFVLQWLSLLWEIQIMLLSQFPSTFQQIHNGMHCIAFLIWDYSHLRNVPWEDILDNVVLLLLLVNYVRGF